MQRWARTHFHVVRISRWSIAMMVLVVLALLLFPARGLMPVAGQQAAPENKVRQGVTLYNRDFSGKSETEAREMLAEMAALLTLQPVPAHESRDPISGVSYVVPELNGYSLDVDTTWFRLSVASEGTRVEPATLIQPPPRRLADFPQSVIRQGNPKKPAVALLINVDWGTRELIDMLPVLKRHGVKVTFFVSGRWADGNEELLRRMAHDGHEIASHGYNLSQGPIALAAAGRLKSDIARSVESIRKITGNEVRYYAPHMSEISSEILQVAADLNLRTVLYTLDTVDWKPTTTGGKILAVFQKAKPGDLILLHPKPNTASVMEQAILALRGKGLQPMTLTEAISPDPGAPAAAFRGIHE